MFDTMLDYKNVNKHKNTVTIFAFLTTNIFRSVSALQVVLQHLQDTHSL